MSKKMTPCEKLGYKVGDEFEVISHHAFKKGQVVTLHEDDGTECPLFAGDGGGAGVFYGVECSFATLNKQVRKIANKLKPAKQSLADAIHQNGGWVEGGEFAAQDKDGQEGCAVWFYSGGMPYEHNDSWYPSGNGDAIYGKHISCDKPFVNWSQTVLSRDEYYQAYPKVDADGWIEWNGGECPVGDGVLIDVKKVDGSAELAVHDPQDRIWGDTDHRKCIIAYRLHKPDVKPEFCESVMRSIPEPEAKPTIERLAHDYRNKLEYANRKQQEADDAKAAADAALGELERAGEALGLLIGIAKSDQEP